MGDWLSGLFGGGGATPGLLTSDQQAMQSQLGWYPNPDMVLPSGAPNTQPTGYSGLTPAQVATVNQLGYYTQPGAQPQSLWDKLKQGLGSGQLGDALGKLNQAAGAGTPQPRPNLAPPPLPPHQGFQYMNPRHNIFTQSSLDPRTALQQLRGY